MDLFARARDIDVILLVILLVIFENDVEYHEQYHVDIT